MRHSRVSRRQLMRASSALAIGARGWDSAVRQLRCYYNLDDIRAVMRFLEERDLAAFRHRPLSDDDDAEMRPVAVALAKAVATSNPSRELIGIAKATGIAISLTLVFTPPWSNW